MEAILHITDFGAKSEHAFLTTCQLARMKSAEIIVLHLIPSEICSVKDRDDDELDRDSPLYQLCWERFSRLAELAYDIPTSLQVKIGRSVGTVAKVAKGELCKVISLAAPINVDSCHHSQAEIVCDPNNHNTLFQSDSLETA